MYDYKMFYVWVEIWFICLKSLVSFTGRFLGSCFYLIYPSKIQKSLSTKQLISTFPLDKLYNIYVIFKRENYLYYDNKF